MGTATATLTIDNYPAGINNIQRMIKVSGTVVIQASPAEYATGGLALSWNVEPIKAQGANAGAPVDVFFESIAGGLYDYGWNKANGTIQIFTASAAVAGGAVYEEMPNTTAIPAGISGDTIRFEAWFERSFG